MVVQGLIACTLLTVSVAHARLPGNTNRDLPVLKTSAQYLWPEFAHVHLLAGQVEQESGWKSRAELRTSREYGFGYGQFTTVYNSDNSERFNKWRELRSQYSELAGWVWDKRFDPYIQLSAVVLLDRSLFRSLPGGVTGPDREDMTFAAYNGGLGGVLSERRLCAAKPRCNPNRWTGHVALHSNKSRTRHKGYGKSFFEINREYPVLVRKRGEKYKHALH